MNLCGTLVTFAFLLQTLFGKFIPTCKILFELSNLWASISIGIQSGVLIMLVLARLTNPNEFGDVQLIVQFFSTF